MGRVGLCLVLWGIACSSVGQDDLEDFSEDDGTAATGPNQSGASGATSPGDSADSQGPNGSGGPKLDVSGDDGTSGTDDEGCKKIDFLFVIDNSGSMRDNQQRLVAAFPGFIKAIRQEVAGTDHHIMVIDSDENPAWLCEEFLDGAHCAGTNLQPNDCNDYVCGSIFGQGACATELGAGVDWPVGGYASNKQCGFPPGRRYLTSEDPDVEAAFACAATVGISGNGDEFPITAAVAAVGDELGAAGACNEGFLRDDAILVVTIVSDDSASEFAPNDDASAGDPDAWFDSVVAAKNGDPEAIVVIGLVPWDDTSCVFDDVPTDRFVDFVHLFEDRGVVGSVCSADYAGLFGQTVSVIDTTCDNFGPAG